MAEELKGRFKFEADSVTMYYPNVITPRMPDFGGGRKGKPSYQIQVGIRPDHPDLPALKKLIGAVAKAKFGRLTGVSFPIKDGDERADKAKARGKNREFLRGQVILKAGSTQYAPQLFYMSDGAIVEVEEGMRSQVGSKFYSGCEGTVGINLVAYPGNGDNIPDSVVAYLADVVSLCRGKKIGGGAEKFSGFAKNVGVVSDQDPTADIGDDDDEIPY
jgi:hypothetical protein